MGDHIKRKKGMLFLSKVLRPGWAEYVRLKQAIVKKGSWIISRRRRQVQRSKKISNPFYILPPEMLEKVFGYLNLQDKQGLRSVSKSMEALLNPYVQFRYPIFDNDSYQALVKTQKFSDINSLIIGEFITVEKMKRIYNFERVCKLELLYTEVIPVANLRLILNSCPALVEITASIKRNCFEDRQTFTITNTGGIWTVHKQPGWPLWGVNSSEYRFLDNFFLYKEDDYV